MNDTKEYIYIRNKWGIDHYALGEYFKMNIKNIGLK